MGTCDARARRTKAVEGRTVHTSDETGSPLVRFLNAHSLQVRADRARISCNVVLRRTRPSGTLSVHGKVHLARAAGRIVPLRSMARG
eukprot:409097-Pleurochrysis_carterae.AAC.4